MGKYLSIIIGAVAVLIGLMLLSAWRGDLIVVVKGILPVMFLFSGVIAVIAGFSEIKDERLTEKTAEKKE